MKKVYIALLLGLLSTSSYALDLSAGSSKSLNIDIKNDKSKSKDLSINKSKNKEESKTKSVKEDMAETNSLSFDGKVKILTRLTDIERLTKEYNLQAADSFFSKCSLLTAPRFNADFGLTCKTKFGSYNSGLCSFLNTAASNYAPLKDVLNSRQEKALKEYIVCGLVYGGYIAEVIKTQNVENDFFIEDEEINDMMIDFLYDLEESDCKLGGNLNTIICGGLTADISKTLKVYSNNFEVFGGNEYYGYKLNISKSKSVNKSIDRSLKFSKSKSKSLSVKKTSNSSRSKAIQMNQNAAANISTSSFMKD